MVILYLNDILEKAGLKIPEVLLIRHVLSDKVCRKYYESGNLKEFTQIQKEKHFCKNYKYWITFIGCDGNNAILDKCYEVKHKQKNIPEDVGKGFIDEKWFPDEAVYFDIQEIDLLKKYENRLIIDWGKGARIWKQRAANNKKEVIAIQSKQKVDFVGYENLVLTYEQLKKIIEDSLTYADWQAALASIYAIYLIVDKGSGKQYIGSAYGDGGLLQRWSEYVETKHGNNKKMIKWLNKYPKKYAEFQFSILQICSKNMTEQEMIGLENLYKRKLLTKEFGFNDN